VYMGPPVLMFAFTALASVNNSLAALLTRPKQLNKREESLDVVA